MKQNYCNICGSEGAEYLVSMQCESENNNDGFPFFLCENHEYLYERMAKKGIHALDLFEETAKILA